MLDNYMTNNYSFPSYTYLNDNLLYLDYIEATYSFNYVTATPDQAFRYQGNLFGLFKELGIPPSLYVYTMFMNGYFNPMDYDGIKYTFKLAIQPPIPIA